MTNAGKSSFIYVTYIRTTPERLWSALTSQEFARQYWLGAYPDADWKIGGTWKLMFPDGRVGDAGEIVAFEPSTVSAFAGATSSGPNSRQRAGLCAPWSSSPPVRR